MRKAFILGLIIIAGTAAAFGNIRVKSKQTMGGQSYENTTYVKGKRQRAETMGGTMVNITQCDLRRAIQLNPATKTFIVNEFGGITPGDTTASGGVSQPVTKGGKVISTITIKDTGERKQMFGYTARRLIITMDTDSTPDACSPTKSRMQTDGWYIDFDFAFDCGEQYTYQARPRVKSGGCQDKFEMKAIGTAKRGFAVYEKMTFFDESGKETMSMVNEVVELSKTPLDAALFDVPPDYREVEDMSQMYSSISSSSMGSSSGPSSSSSMGLPKTNASVSSEALGAKKAGTIRIGIATVKTGSVGNSISASDLATVVQNSFAEYLKLPNVEVVQLETKLTSAIDAEAQQKECDFVIYSNVSHKNGGGGFGMFGKALGSAIGQTGIGHTGSTAGNIAGQIATQTVVSATSMSSQVKAKDQITLDVKLTRIGGVAAFAKVYKARAKSGGDDIISKVIEQAATNIVETVGK